MNALISQQQSIQIFCIRTNKFNFPNNNNKIFVNEIKYEQCHSLIEIVTCASFGKTVLT